MVHADEDSSCSDSGRSPERKKHKKPGKSKANVNIDKKANNKSGKFQKAKSFNKPDKKTVKTNRLANETVTLDKFVPLEDLVRKIIAVLNVPFNDTTALKILVESKTFE